jgi:hypothetical protein
MFLNCSTCFGLHTAHHQELKKCNCSLWFYIHLWLPAAAMAELKLNHCTVRQPKTYVKPEAAFTFFELLIMGGVSPETCWAIKKHWNNKFYYTVTSCWVFLIRHTHFLLTGKRTMCERKSCNYTCSKFKTHCLFYVPPSLPTKKFYVLPTKKTSWILYVSQ